MNFRAPLEDSLWPRQASLNSYTNISEFLLLECLTCTLFNYNPFLTPMTHQFRMFRTASAYFQVVNCNSSPDHRCCKYSDDEDAEKQDDEAPAEAHDEAEQVPMDPSIVFCPNCFSSGYSAFSAALNCFNLSVTLRKN